MIGWILDVYADRERGLVIWFVGEDGTRDFFTLDFPVTFYASGPLHRLEQLARYLEKDRGGSVQLSQTNRKDLMRGGLQVLAVRVDNPSCQPGVFHTAYRKFPDLEYFDADIPVALRFAAATGVFPLTRCRLTAYTDNRVARLEPLDSRWDVDAPFPPIEIMTIVPEDTPKRKPPAYVTVKFGAITRRVYTHDEVQFVHRLGAIIWKYDPDVLLTRWGDTWLLPHLIMLAEKHNIPFNPGRDPDRTFLRREAFSYHTYGRTEHRGEQVHLYGRWHIDQQNAVMFKHYGLSGAFELARVGGLSLQEGCRKSPGASLTAMQMLVALERDILIPYQKSQTEAFKTPEGLIRADRGGLVAQPVVGVHGPAAGIDFFSMYAQIMSHFNISPETILFEGDAEDPSAIPIPEFGISVLQAPQGLVPKTVAPILEKRKSIKMRMADMDRHDCRYNHLDALAAALKWLLLVSFGYMGYKRFRWMRVEAHEAITAFGREILMQAKEIAEGMGFSVVYFNVDGLYVKRDGARTPEDFQPLLDAIERQTGLSIALDHVFDWIAFLPSRQDERIPVANRYFGVYRDRAGRVETKVRGLETRRHDTPNFVGDIQRAVLESLSGTRDLSLLPEKIPSVVDMLQKRLASLRAGKIPIEDLVCAHVLSRPLDQYRVPSPGARAAKQLAGEGKEIHPGQKVLFVHTRDGEGVVAWELARRPPVHPDVGKYETLAVRAASNVLQPFGVNEETLRVWLASGMRWLLCSPIHSNRKKYPTELSLHGKSVA